MEAHLQKGERVLWSAQPVRPAGGGWVWMIMALGVAFTGAAFGALVDAWTAPSFALGAWIILLLFLPFSLLLVAWPLLAYRRLRRTSVAITDRGVIVVVGTRVKRTPKSAITSPQLARRRGNSASLVLSEVVRQKSDGTPVYEWVAVHGLPDAENALAALMSLKG